MSDDANAEIPNLDLIDRLEVIDETGRAYVNTDVAELEFSIQDDGRTLKIFLKSA